MLLLCHQVYFTLLEPLQNSSFAKKSSPVTIMKKTSLHLILLISTLLTACTTDKPIEQALRQCIEEKYTQNNKNYQETAQILKDLLKKEGLLHPQNPTSYDSLLNTFATNPKTIKIDPILHKRIAENSPKNFGAPCIREVYRFQYRNSKLRKWANALEKMAWQGELNEKNILQKLSETLTPKDFSEPLYQEIVLWTIYELHIVGNNS